MINFLTILTKIITHALYFLTLIPLTFDSLDHKILLKKLDHYGFRGKIWNLLKSYLENRKICTIVDQKVSKIFKVTHGIPQGSVLGPLLFLLFINDLPQASNFDATLFADDANLHISHQNPDTLQIIVNEEIKKSKTGCTLVL